MDYKVVKVESFPVNWYEKKKTDSHKDDKNTVYRSYVLAAAQGDFIMPVEAARNSSSEGGRKNSRALGRREPLD